MNQTPVQLTNLPLEAIVKIIDYCDIKTLSKVRFTSNELLSYIKMSTVVRSSLFAGGHVLKNIMRINRLVSEGLIWLPSRIRLIQIATGTKCEFCHQRELKLVHKDFGLFICKECLVIPQVLNLCSKQGSFYEAYRDVFDHVIDNKLIITQRSGWRTIPQNLTDENLSWAEKMGIETRFRSDTTVQVRDLHHLMWNVKIQDRSGANIGPIFLPSDVMKLIHILRKIQKDRWVVCFNDFYERLSENMKESSEYKEFISTYNMNISCAERHDVEKDWIASTKDTLYCFKKLKTCIDFVSRLKEHIDHPVLTSSILSFQIDARFFNKKERRQHPDARPIIFFCSWMNDIMREPLKRCTNYSEESIAQLAVYIRQTGCNLKKLQNSWNDIDGDSV